MKETIGIVGGGQLGRMLTEAAKPLGLHVVVTNPGENGPAAQVGAEEIVAPLNDTAALDELAQRSDILTWEIEHIPAEYLCQMEERGVRMAPSPRTLATIQDKLTQKRMLQKHGIPVAPFTGGIYDLKETLGEGPYIVKTRRQGYDGRGNLVVPEGDWDGVETRLSKARLTGPYLTEKVLNFDKELSVVAAIDHVGNMSSYPVVETIHKDNICHTTITPADISTRIERQAMDLARDTMKVMEGAGVFAMEMFQVGDDVMINEIAPRVHNSGHWTIEGAATSQFEQHIRAIMGLPLGSTVMRAPAVVMVNILGRDEGDNGYQSVLHLKQGLEVATASEDTHVHLYGKESRPQRKIGHITSLADTVGVAIQRATGARATMPV